jgi:alpha/beta superfamily hydrolase
MAIWASCVRPGRCRKRGFRARSAGEYAAGNGEDRDAQDALTGVRRASRALGAAWLMNLALCEPT